MKKRVLMLLFFVIFLLHGNIVRAEEYKCVYSIQYEETSGSGTKESTMIVNTSDETIVFEQGFGNEDLKLLDPELDSTWTEKFLISDYLKGKCPDKIYACKVKKSWTGASGNNSTETNLWFPLINIGLEDKVEYKNLSQSDSDQSGANTQYWLQDEDCKIAQYKKEGSTADSVTLNFACEKYDSLYGIVKDKYCSGLNCSIQDLNEYKAAKDKLRNYCVSKFKSSYYFDPCVQSCFDIASDMEEVEGEVPAEFQCGMSENLINFIVNILRWVKYIIPALVILLGILDFIRAISSNSEDEMKKAQSRFIKRLIAAAILFIVPFIIEFALDIVGIGSGNPFCGLND